jgi:hypothetical protein
MVLFSTILLFMVVKNSLAKMLANADDLAGRPYWTDYELSMKTTLCEFWLQLYANIA